MSSVNHPSHYNQGQIEVIDAIEDWKLGFNAGNAVKYITRYQHKGTPISDVEKAICYLNRLLGEMKVLTERERTVLALRTWLATKREAFATEVAMELEELLQEISTGYYSASH